VLTNVRIKDKQKEGIEMVQIAGITRFEKSLEDLETADAEAGVAKTAFDQAAPSRTDHIYWPLLSPAEQIKLIAETRCTNSVLKSAGIPEPD
jgi:hypothetical protein